MLSQIDAFFVAYQERSGVLMQLGAEAELRGKLTPSLLQAMLSQVVGRWPQLGQTLRRRLFGLRWDGDVRTKEILHIKNEPEAVSTWRNRPMNPFVEPPFQLLWIPGLSKNILAFRIHHAVMDAQAFIHVCTKALDSLSRLSAGEVLPIPEKIPGRTLLNLIKPLKVIQQGKLKSMWRYVRWMSAEAASGRSARIVMQKCEPGNIDINERTLDEHHVKELKKNASALHVTPFWIIAAAWMRTINTWNEEQSKMKNSLISLEVPVSLRGKYSTDRCIGNFLSTLILFGDAAQPAATLASSLRQQFFKDIKNRSYLGMPLFTSPGKYLPWVFFRRVAVTSKASGYATSHFTWLEDEKSLSSEIYEHSKGTLELEDLHMYGTLCLRMGASLFVHAMPHRIKMFITHRLNALPTSAANRLAELLLSELRMY
jgi:NRPS condensation-like uncharacterized protein